MKTQLSLLACLLLAGSATAQTQKGNGILSGDVSVSYYRAAFVDTGESKKLGENWSSSVSLTAGRFWTDNWLAGVSASVSAYNQSQYLGIITNERAEFTGTSVSVTPFVRRYWQVSSVQLFAGLGLSAGTSVFKQPAVNANGQYVNDGQRRTLLNVNPLVEAGVNYFLTNRLGLQLRANASALPLNTAGLSAGLVYWTGPDRRTGGQEERDNPQTNKGNLVIEGSFSVVSQQEKVVGNTTTSPTETTTDTYLVSPSVGYFFGKNNLVGLSLPVSWGTNLRPTLSSSAGTWSIGVSPYYQHYWLTTRLTPYTRITAGYNRMTTKPDGTTQNALTANTFTGGVAIGLAYMAGQRFIIETSLAQASANYTSNNESSIGNFSSAWNGTLSAGLGGNFSVRYVLR